MRRGFGRRVRASLLGSAIVIAAVSSGGGGAPPAAAATGSASCTEAGVTWKVDYSTRPSTFGGDLYKVTALTRNGADASTQTWSLRWDLQSNQYPAPPPPPPAAGALSYNQVVGPLAGTGGVGSREVVDWLSPRVVTPDGSCTVYLRPFGNRGLTSATAPRVAVLGDDLVRQLNDSTANVVPNQGYVERDLNVLGARTEVEGHIGARWIASGAGATDKTLVDEFKGLLEHETDGFVMSAGVNDALDLAAGDPATLATRAQAWRVALEPVLNELRTRSGCVTLVTIPDNASSLDPEYKAAAEGVNAGFHWFAAQWGPTDPLTVVDFAALARTHLFGSAEPWFTSDNVHLAAAGLDAYTDAVTNAARRCSESAVLYGKAGTLDFAPPNGNYANRQSLPTGQPLVKRPVPGWDIVPSRMWYRSVAAADGNVFIANLAHSANPFQAAAKPGQNMVISRLDPNNNTFSNIKIKTDKGNEVVTGEDGTTRGFDLGDIEASADGKAILFTGGTGVYNNTDAQRDAQGMWPVFGILTKGADGTWRVAEGTGWQNQWSPRQLYDAATNKTLANTVCPEMFFSLWRDCKLFTELDTLPNGDIAVTQYFGGVTILRLTGPDASGRYGIDIVAYYQHPVVDDPSSETAGVNLGVLPREVESDPTSGGNDIRFGVGNDTFYENGSGGGHPGNVTEYRYNPSHPDPLQRIQPVSAPTMTGEIGTAVAADGKKRFVTSSPFLYDHQGNLWIGQADGLGGKGIAVFAKTATGRKLSNGTCSFDPAQWATYRLDAAGTRSAWGKACKPDYLVVQPRAYGAAWELNQDPVTKAIGTNALQGLFYLIQPSGSGANMSFSVSGPVATMGQQLQTGNLLTLRTGTFDNSGRAWVLARRFGDSGGTDPMEVHNQWAFSLDVSRMLGREPLQLPVTPAKAKVVQAELTLTKATMKRAGTFADFEFDSAAGYAGCQPDSACVDPVSNWPFGGMVLGDETSATAGVPTNTTVEYQVVVPKGGSYQVTYKARDRNLAGVQNIRLTANGTAHTTEVASAEYATITGPTLTLAAGTHTIQLTAPTGGWQLDWFSLTRQ